LLRHKELRSIWPTVTGEPLELAANALANAHG